MAVCMCLTILRIPCSLLCDFVAHFLSRVCYGFCIWYVAVKTPALCFHTADCSPTLCQCSIVRWLSLYCAYFDVWSAVLCSYGADEGHVILSLRHICMNMCNICMHHLRGQDTVTFRVTTNLELITLVPMHWESLFVCQAWLRGWVKVEVGHPRQVVCGQLGGHIYYSDLHNSINGIVY